MALANIRCRLDADLDQSLFAYQETLGQQLISARELLDTIRGQADSLTAAFCDPLRAELDAVLATAGISTEDLINATSLVSGATPEDLETTTEDRFDLTLVNGRLIVPGTKDLSVLQQLTRMLGSLDELFTAVPDLAELPITDDTDWQTYSTPIELPARFILVSTYLKRVVIPATSCTPESVSEIETTIGVDLPLSEAAAQIGIPLSEVRKNVFWLGTPAATDSTRRKSRILELTNSQFVDAVAKVNRENFFVYVITDPLDIARASGAWGTDATDVISRANGPVAFFPTIEDRAAIIRDALRSSSPGSSGPSGVPDFSSPAAAVFLTLDVAKTFGLDTLASNLMTQVVDESSASQFAEALAASIQSQLEVISAIIEEAQAVLGNILTEITNLLSVVNMLFNDLSNGLLDCLLGNTFSPNGFASVDVGLDVGVGDLFAPGSPGVPGVSTSNPLDGMLELVEDQAGIITEFFSTVSDLLGIASDVSCGSNFVNSSSSLQSSFGGSLPCQTDVLEESGFELPEFYTESLGIAKVVMDVLTSMFDTVRSALRGLRITVGSLNLSLRLSLERRNSSASSSSLPSPAGSLGCAPAEAVQLAQLLAQRAIAAFTPAS